MISVYFDISKSLSKSCICTSLYSPELSWPHVANKPTIKMNILKECKATLKKTPSGEEQVKIIPKLTSIN